MIQRKNQALSQLNRKLITLYSKSLFQKVKIESKNFKTCPIECCPNYQETHQYKHLSPLHLTVVIIRLITMVN